MDTGNTIKLSLSAWRKARELTLRDMAAKIGVSTITYNRWEKDPSKISLGKAIEISRALNVDFDNIIFFNESDT